MDKNKTFSILLNTDEIIMIFSAGSNNGSSNNTAQRMSNDKNRKGTEGTNYQQHGNNSNFLTHFIMTLNSI